MRRSLLARVGGGGGVGALPPYRIRGARFRRPGSLLALLTHQHILAHWDDGRIEHADGRSGHHTGTPRPRAGKERGPQPALSAGVRHAAEDGAPLEAARLEILARLERTLGPRHGEVAQARATVPGLRFRLEETRQAQVMWRVSIADIDRAFGESHAELQHARMLCAAHCSRRTARRTAAPCAPRVWPPSADTFHPTAWWFVRRVPNLRTAAGVPRPSDGPCNSVVALRPAELLARMVHSLGTS